MAVLGLRKHGVDVPEYACADRLGVMLSNRGRRERRRAIAFVGVILFLLILGVSAWFLFPIQDEPRESDAVLVMAGASDGRHELGAQLIEDGVSENFVVSNPSGANGKVGYAHCQGSSKPESATATWCMKPRPVTTTGEALSIDKLAKEEGWVSVTAVTNRPHNHRVRTNLEHCTDLDYSVVSIDEVNFSQVPVQIAREIGGYLKFWMTNPC